MEEKDVSLLDYIHIIVKWRKFIILNFFIVSILSAAITLIIPKTFTATAVIMPPEKSNFNFFSGLSSDLPIGGLGNLLGGAFQDLNTFLAILKSRTIAENTIKKFDLIKRYESESIEEAVRIFQNNMNVEVEVEGTINIDVSIETGFFHYEEDEKTARNLCAEITNYMVSELDRTNTEFQIKQAKYNRIFIGKRYEVNKSYLKNVEEEIKSFGETYGVISLPDQVVAAIEVAAQLESQILITGIELETLKKSQNSQHPEIQKKQFELQEMRKKLDTMKRGNGEKDISTIFPAFTDAPKLGVRYIRLQRELEVQSLLYQFLSQQYEQAKIEEARDTPSVQILDNAIPPIKKAKPKRTLIVLISGFLALFLSVLYAFFVDYWRELNEAQLGNK